MGTTVLREDMDNSSWIALGREDRAEGGLSELPGRPLSISLHAQASCITVRRSSRRLEAALAAGPSDAAQDHVDKAWAVPLTRVRTIAGTKMDEPSAFLRDAPCGGVIFDFRNAVISATFDMVVTILRGSKVETFRTSESKVITDDGTRPL